MTQNKNSNAQWGGRFKEATDEFVKFFTASIDFDKQLAKYDIQGSIAHATMLAHCKIITNAERDDIIGGLETIRTELEQFAWSRDLEDVHMNIEAELINRIGETGKKLHTGRSRNDQVATDIRLFLRQEIDEIDTQLNHALRSILRLASQHTDTIMPGYTHLQTAQPIVFAHHLLAWYEMLSRDLSRLRDCRKRTNTLPLGAAALAGTSYPIDRHFVAELLGFDAVCENSLDAVSDRDFIIEFLSMAAVTMMHLSRMSEELIMWSSMQFNFIQLPDRYCTGSSIMPQKKNPDVPELIRGKSGRVYGNLFSLLTLMKAQPLAYNKDNQEDKEPLFDSVITLKHSLTACIDMIPNIKVNKSAMSAAADGGYSTATDLADYLVKKGVAFRDAHEIVGKTVAYAIDKNARLNDLTLNELQDFSQCIESDVMEVLTLEGSVNARNHIGGTATAQVKKRITQLMQAYG